ncbi:hypothetical protein MG290_10465 [Flavobacterium sp. CBA20B-1]|uniref:hypothetical protein n=1 Tax=unclassified Flavobacterium TaxID=196869 RepID=UPI0022253977|nr:MULTISPECIES: hypothetical protein [unclassified Flavobacterium]WCM41379.1 hypothetical protein MG290_10465 [Flavobacterium sp. CBA20B-1]
MKFKQSQLNRPLVASSNQYNYKQISNAFYGLLVAGLVVSCSVQKPTQKSIAEYEQLFQTDPFFSDTLQYVIRGIIIDSETKMPATQCFVKLNFNGYGVWSDEFGRFKLNIPEYFVKDTLQISINGNYTKEYFEEIEVLKSELPVNKVLPIEPMELIFVGYYEVDK